MVIINNIFKQRLSNKLNLKCRYYNNFNCHNKRKIYNLDGLEYFLLFVFEPFEYSKIRLDFYNSKRKITSCNAIFPYSYME